MVYCEKFNNILNRWSGDNVNDAFTESPGSWEPDEKQVGKWTAEGAVKWMFSRVFCNVWAYVSCRGYVGILLSARVIPWIKVAPRVESYCRCIYSSLTEAIFLSGTFFIFIKLLWREISVKGAFLKGGCNMLLTRYWRCFCAPDIEFK